MLATGMENDWAEGIGRVHIGIRAEDLSHDGNLIHSQ